MKKETGSGWHIVRYYISIRLGLRKTTKTASMVVTKTKSQTPNLPNNATSIAEFIRRRTILEDEN